MEVVVLLPATRVSGAEKLPELVTRWTTDALTDLGVDVPVEVLVTHDGAAPFQLRIAGRPCPVRPAAPLGADERALAALVVLSVLDHRGVFLDAMFPGKDKTGTDQAAVRARLDPGGVLAALPDDMFIALAGDLVQRWFSLHRLRDTADAETVTSDPASWDRLAEALTAGKARVVAVRRPPPTPDKPGSGDLLSRALGLMVSWMEKISSGAVPDEDIERTLEQVVQGFMDGFGIPLPPVVLEDDGSVPPGEVRIRRNDVRLPPVPYPALADWLAVELAWHAPALLDADTVEFLTARLAHTDPDLVEAAVAGLGRAALTRIVRDLAGDGIGVTELWAVLETIRTVRGATLGPDPAEFVDAIRVVLWRRISRAWAWPMDGRPGLAVRGVDAEIERELRSGVGASSRWFEQVAAVGGSEKWPSPIVVTDSAVRRRLRALLPVAPGAYTVLSRDEVAPEVVLHWVGRITPPVSS